MTDNSNFLSEDLNKIKICQLFLNSLSIRYQMVKTAAKNSYHLNSSTVADDSRGSQRIFAVSDHMKQNVRDHINSFSTVSSHYCRKKTTKQYLDAALNITKMFDLYKKDYEGKSLTVAIASMYLHIEAYFVMNLIILYSEEGPV